MSLIEIVAASAGLLCVWLVTRQSILCWPVGLLQVTLYVWVFYEAKLYSDVLLHLIYVVLQIYGWHYWLHGGRNAAAPPVTRLAVANCLQWLTVGVLGTAVLGLTMARLTDAALPYWDAGIAVFSLVAQVLLARKIFENWFVWIGVDSVAIGVYAAKALYVTAGLYAVFLGLCVLGLIEWRRTLPAREPA
jgi:nicotinamide mononucleotide transporter